MTAPYGRKTPVECPKAGTRSRWLGPVLLLLFLAFISTCSSSAQTRPKPVRIGALTVTWGASPQIVGLRKGLLELGYRENRDFVIGVRFTRGNVIALDAVARELIDYGVDILIADHDPTAQALQKATQKIPIIFVSVGDPVGLGLVKTFARPGGNLTGIADLDIDFSPKRLELLQKIAPRIKRVLLPYNASYAASLSAIETINAAAARLGLELIKRPLRTEDEARQLLTQLRSGEVDGMLQAPFGPLLNIPALMVAATNNAGIPAMFDSAFWLSLGALAGYGPDSYIAGKRAARLVDKVIKGADPAAIPVEVNTKLEFAVNLKVANQIGLNIPPEVLFRADRLVR